MTTKTQNPIELFNDSVAHLERATEMAVMVSEANIGIHHTGRQNRALFLLAKLIAHDMSILTIISCYKRSSKGSALLDHFSIASLSRIIADASVMTMYISHPKLQRDEWNLRRYVLYLHDACNRKRFLSSIKSDDVDFISSYRRQKATLIERIRHFSASLRLPNDLTKELVSGQRVFVSGLRGAVREAGWDVNQFELLQSYLSAYVHSHPVSFMRADEHRISFSDPSDFQFGFAAYAMEAAATYTDRVRERMAAFSISDGGDPLGPVDD